MYPTADAPADPRRVSLDRRASRRIWPFALAAAIVLVGLSLAVPGGRHEWALAIVRQPARYTALAFQDAAGLPKTLTAGAPLRLSFTVTNDEGRPFTYAYVVTSASGAASPSVLEHASLAVPAGGQRSATVSVQPVCAASPCTVQISLPDVAETIDALVNLPVPKP